MPLLIDDPNATDMTYINLQKDLLWLNPPNLARQHVESLYEYTKDILDKKFTNQCKSNFHSCYAEMYFAGTFRSRGKITVTHPSDKGPDFFLENFNAWAEVISTTDGVQGNPNTIPKPTDGKSCKYPEEKVILRLRNSFETKSNKIKLDIDKKIIEPDQPTVICISGGAMDERVPIYSVGGYPQIIKTVLPVGDFVFWIDRETRKITSTEYKYREGIEKITTNGNRLINTEPFLNEEYSHISAVIYSWANPGNPIEQEKWGCDFYIIHNPLAKNPLPKGFLKCGHEYHITVTSESFTIEPVITHEII